MEIVGLKNVQDDVNKLIAKFVGFQSKTAVIIEKERKRFVAFEEKIEEISRREGLTHVSLGFRLI